MGYKANIKRATPSAQHQALCVRPTQFDVRKGDVRICEHGRMQYAPYHYKWCDLYWLAHPIIYSRAVQVLSMRNDKEDPDAEAR